MLKNILSVGGFTLLSRITGLLRDQLMAAIIGRGVISDALVVALRLPNQFRAIFAEGAFSAAFVPAFLKVRTREGVAQGNRFQAQILSLLMIAQIVIVALALLFTEPFVKLFLSDPGRLPLAVELTRITFPFLLFITLMTFWSGVLNATGKFAAAAAASVIMNLCWMGALLVSFWFKTPGHAVAWGVLLAGVIEAAFVGFAAHRAGLLVWPARPKLDIDVKAFFRSFVPAVIGSAGVQIAILADTIIAGWLPIGSLSAMFYAERLYQLPVGIIAIAGGTVLLPAMSRLIAEGKTDEAHAAQNRTAAIIFALAAPCCVAFFLLPDVIIAGLFERGAFKASDTIASGSILAAYSIGLPAIVMIRAVIPSFQSRGDTRTPMLVSLFAVAVNVAFKFALTGSQGATGLALATSIGAWVNLILLVALAWRRKEMAPDADLFWGIANTLMACLWLVAAILLEPLLSALVLRLPSFHNEARLVLVALVAALVYFGLLFSGLSALKLRLFRR
ncbi:MAG: murein biosynthesis integral membrane protein MurJ [Beijerinckiaceae bacterium]|nr:murein biosynthesis integral membrane protein MurJ [Beijerinckiaceae bacterium]